MRRLWDFESLVTADEFDGGGEDWKVSAWLACLHGMAEKDTDFIHDR